MRPMLAATIDDIHTIRYPVLASRKIDGIRGLVIDGVLVGRSLKPIPNRHVAGHLSNPVLNGLDGELIVGAPNSATIYRDTMSGIMSHGDTPDYTYLVFDLIANATALDRQLMLHDKVSQAGLERIQILTQTMLSSPDELIQYEIDALTDGYEGVIVRSLDSPYKHGRSTSREGYLCKIKRYKDAEAKIIGYQELMHNANSATVDELGYTARSSHKANKIGRATLGALLVADINTGVEFAVGTGFNDADRAHIWDNRDRLFGKIITYKYFDVGCKDAPRHPVYKGFRDPVDF